MRSACISVGGHFCTGDVGLSSFPSASSNITGSEAFSKAILRQYVSTSRINMPVYAKKKKMTQKKIDVNHAHADREGYHLLNLLTFLHLHAISTSCSAMACNAAASQVCFFFDLLRELPALLF
jgi:hypothetical protein